jgi:hypothetical protein
MAILAKRDTEIVQPLLDMMSIARASSAANATGQVFYL